jgi:L-lysine exporter family protein LysE/ArgO
VRWGESLAAGGAGLVFGLSLIVAIGPQNAFVLRQGLRREHLPLVVGLCAVSDAALIAGGVGGAGAALNGRHWLLTGFAVAGAAFLLSYGASAARRALHPARLATADGERPAAWRTVLLTCLAFTWLNPWVYIDTVFLVAPLSRTHAPDQWDFAAGAMLASAAWFAALGYGARALRGLLARPAAWRVVDGAIAAIMLTTAARLLVEA